MLEWCHHLVPPFLSSAAFCAHCADTTSLTPFLETAVAVGGKQLDLKRVTKEFEVSTVDGELFVRIVTEMDPLARCADACERVLSTAKLALKSFGTTMFVLPGDFVH